METVVAYPGNGMFAQQVARAFLDHHSLKCFATTFAFRSDSLLSRSLTAVPVASIRRLRDDLERRRISEVPREFLSTQPFWEIVRSVLARAGASPPVVDRVWDLMAHRFTRRVARDLVPACEAIYAYEYTALEAFERAKTEGVARVLDLPSLSSREFESVQRREKEEFPELSTAHDEYFRGKFERRQARRDREIALADVIVTNSSLTAQSHVDNGADRSKIVTVPLAAPPPIGGIDRRSEPAGPLRVIWAGPFSIGKGAHYFLEAWRQFASSPHVAAEVFGAITIPDRLLRQVPSGIEFLGSRPQPELFAAFRQADVLIFPTLSDGFGMVVTEAFANGLPVITTERAGAADLVEHGKNGLIIRAGDSRAIADALQWCLDNRERLSDMRFAALETARRWQWPDYRRALISAVGAALQRAGYRPRFEQKAVQSDS
jgi:glycosyltransferase involved in cell wall biosynthesis